MKIRKQLLIKIYLSSLIGDWMLRLIYNSNSWHINGEKNYLNSLKDGKSILISCWHGQLLSCLRFLSNNNYNAIAGMHKDAEIISRIAKKWGFNLIRGSNKEKGAIAFKNIVHVLKKSPDVLFITPDGPSGPARIPKKGIIRAAKLTGALVVPASVYSTKRWSFTNWDTFFLEKPFGEIYLKFGKPIVFEKEFSDNHCSKVLINHMNINEDLNIKFAKEQFEK
tara:strand:+ start:318 stop:986 length:669 start_codon:yes stop_codon:yes gene_type:complete